MGKAAFVIYNAALHLAIPLVLIRYLAKGLRQRAYFKGFTQRFGFVSHAVSPGAIWVHAVSVGEVNAAAPLIKALLNMQYSVVITCVTPTGAAQIRRTFGESVDSCYAPIDSAFFVAKFLSIAKPAALIILETEIWPNMIRCCAKRHVPVYFANMRISDRTHRIAQRVRPLFEHVTQSVKRFNVQTERDHDRIASLGIEDSRIRVTGSLKFDTVVAEDLDRIGAQLRSRWGPDRPAVILGSSHDPEERIFVEVFTRLRADYPDLVCIIVPRHPERFDSVCKDLVRTGCKVLRRTDWNRTVSGENVDIVLVDTMGELVDFYSACDIAVVGGSFVEVGGHNVLEPLAAGRPVIFGSCMSNFAEVAKSVVEHRAGVQVADGDGLFDAVKAYLNDDRLRSDAAANGQAFIELNRGALKRTLDGLPL